MELPIQLILRRWWLTLVVATLLAGAAGYVVARSQTPVYESQVQLLVGRSSDDLSTIRAASSLAETYSELVVRGPTLIAASTEVGIPIDAERVSAQANELTRILTINVRHTTPDGAAKLADALATELIKISEATKDAKSAGQVTVIEGASANPIPVSPKRPLVVALAAIAGLAAVSLLALVVELATDRVRDAADAESLTGAPCIALASTGRRWLSRRRSAHDDYGLVATVLDGHDGTRDARTVAVSTAGQHANDGAVAMRLAEALATGGNVVLVDADPAGTLTAQLRVTGSGLSDLVATQQFSDTRDALDPFVRRTSLSSLTLVPAGSANAGVVEAEQAAKVLQRLLNLGSRVVLITGDPLDQLSLGWTRSADAVILVATDRTRRSDLSDTARGLRTAGARLAATLLRSR